MKKRLILCISLLFVSIFSISAGEKEEKPNIIFILADDLGFSDLGCTGSDLYETPNIDEFASESMYFKRAYSSHPTCQPSRLSIQTGKYPARLGCVSHAALGGVKGGPLQMPYKEVTIGNALQFAGYKTCHIGKWHVGTDDNTPENRGYDLDVASNDFCCPVNYFYPYGLESHPRNDLAAVPDLEDRTPEDFLTEAVTEEAVKFIQNHEGGPFFLNMSYYAVHTPIQAEKDKVKKYKNLITDEHVHRNAKYAGLIEHLDDGVGRILKAIEDKGIADNTIVIFTSDNGGEIGHGITVNKTLRSGKGSLFEGGCRVPLFIKWPGVTTPGSSSNERVIGCDFYPTILSMAATEGDSGHNKELDGVDLTHILKDPTVKLDDRMLHYLRYLSLIHFKPSNLTELKRPCASIIKDDWKLMEFFELPTKPGYYLLFNLKDDPSEKTNLAKSYPEKVEALKEAMYEWRKSVNAPAYDMVEFYGESEL